MNTNDKSLVRIFQKESEVFNLGKDLMNNKWPVEISKLPIKKLKDRVDGYTGFIIPETIEIVVTQHTIYVLNENGCIFEQMTAEQAELQALAFQQAADMHKLLKKVNEGLGI